MTISVPDEVRERIERTEEDVNWSAVATAAFQAKLAEIAAREEHEMTDEAVLERLRASEAKYQSEEHQAGHEVGAEWAKRRAEAAELRRLERWAEEAPRYLTAESDLAWEVFVAAMAPELPDARECSEWWESAAGLEQQPENAFVEGFAEGALAVWNRVQAEL